MLDQSLVIGPGTPLSCDGGPVTGDWRSSFPRPGTHRCMLVDSYRQKNRAKRRSAVSPQFLQAGDVRCLQPLGAGSNFELNRLAFVQRFVPLRLNRGEVDEDVLAGLALDEPESLAGIEPLYCSLFFHGVSFSLI
jgi:hypothetical protein